MTLLRGEVIARDGYVISTPGRGEYLAREL